MSNVKSQFEGSQKNKTRESEIGCPVSNVKCQMSNLGLKIGGWLERDGSFRYLFIRERSRSGALFVAVISRPPLGADAAKNF